MIRAIWIKHRTVATWVTAALLLPVWYVAVYGPQLQRDQELAAAADATRARIEAVQSRLQLAGTVTADLSRGQTTWLELSDNLVAPEKVDLLLARVKNVATRNRVTVLNSTVDFDPLLDKVNKGSRIETVDRIGLQLEGRGRYFRIGDYIDSLDREPVVAEIEELELTYEPAADPEIYFKVSLSLFILPEAVESP